MRNAFASEVAALAREDSRVVLLSGDIGNRLFDELRGQHPDRFFNCGVAEANMMSVAAGMAMSGLRPFTYTITPFTTFRCLEQIKVDVCYHRAPVVIVGTGAGLSYAELGATHHALEDIAILAALPEMAVVCPGDPLEVRLAVRAALQRDGPTYLRLGKKGEPPIHSVPPRFEIGRAIEVREGTDVALLSTGSTLGLAGAAADLLAREGISARVVSFHTVKPLDEAMLRDAFRRHRAVATVEEHSLVGGFGARVAEWVADHPGQPARLVRFATPDAFYREVGDQAFARARFGLTPGDVAGRLLDVLHKGGA